MSSGQDSTGSTSPSHGSETLKVVSNSVLFFVIRSVAFTHSTNDNEDRGPVAVGTFRVHFEY